MRGERSGMSSIKGTVTVAPAVTMLIVAVDRDTKGTMVLCEFIVADDPPSRHWIRIGEAWRGDLTLDIG